MDRAKGKIETARWRYENFVINSPDKASQVESFARLSSYIIPAGFRGSSLLSELLYSASNLLVLLNDAILRQASGVKLTVPQARLRGWLAVVDCAEVFLELAGEQLGGQPLKWVIILCIQLIKASVRLFLLLKHESGMQCVPMLPPMNRNENQKKTKEDNNVDILLMDSDKSTSTFTLSRSKRVVRTLESAPPMNQRDWKFPSRQDSVGGKSQEEFIERPTSLNHKQRMGEILHITRPLVHLLGMYIFGQSSWKPWLMAGATDVSGLALSGDPRKFRPAERGELRRRTLMLLLYLLRSPFYDAVTKKKLLLLLHTIAQEVPVFGLTLRPVISYLPVWQKIYSYVWTV